MLKRLKRYWSSLKRGRPGSRFEEQYERQRKAQKGGVGRALRIIAGVITLLLGLFFLPAPGPGFIVVAFGATLLAGESRLVARAVDAIEVRGRKLYTWARRRWRRFVESRRATSR
jgi:hypothetical protein